MVTETRAEAYIVEEKADFARRLYRSVPGGTQLKFPVGSAQYGDLTVTESARACS